VRRRRPAGLSGGYVGTITGTITAANVTGPTTQGIDIGDLDSALKAVRTGLAYAKCTRRTSSAVRFVAKSAEETLITVIE